MVDTTFCDVAQFQRVVDNTYPYRWLSFRSNDGTRRDTHFGSNIAWCKSAIDQGRLDGFIVYAVYRPDSGRWADTLMAMVGTPHPRMAVMIDVESWRGTAGAITGDHSADINAQRARLGKWLGSAARVIGYGNGGDLRELWPNRGDVKIILANYSSNPPFPNKIARQYTSSGTVAPFGHPVDVNIAYGLDSAGFAAALGLGPNTASNGSTPFQEDDMGTIDNTEENYQVIASFLQRALKWDIRDGAFGADAKNGATIWDRLGGIRTAIQPVTPDQVQAIAAAIAAQVKIPAPAIDAAAIAKAVNDDAAKRLAS